tara:strand:+ start:1324 stop:1581 length:258 start_codon:yes stop_codon:yes gene_type:complete
MFGHSLLLGTGISIISSGIYAGITHDKYDLRDRKNEYITIFTIILFVSTILVYFMNKTSESLVTNISLEGSNISPSLNNYTKPPF